MAPLSMIPYLTKVTAALFLGHLLLTADSLAQPRVVQGKVQFSYSDQAAKSVSLVGDFNGWSKDEDRMVRDEAGIWHTTRTISPGIFQYKFVVDGDKYGNDPNNPVLVDNFNQSGQNSVFVFTHDSRIELTTTPPAPQSNPNDEYPARPDRKAVYLNIIWHQHQPLYVNPETDQLQGPWVRTHATKDYYDMTAMLRDYPDIHCNVNLTSSLLFQLREYYVNRMKPFVDTRRNRVDVKGLWAKWKGKTDPWIDLALKPTSEFDKEDKAHLYKNVWNAFGISEVMIERFPAYAALKRKLAMDRMPDRDLFTEQEMRDLKFWFYLSHFDPDFLAGPVKLPDGSVCDLSDLVELRDDGNYYLRKRVTEEHCNRIVAEAYKVMANVIPVHKKLMYSPEKHTGQVEVITTPYYHPILPLIYDSDLARICQPNDPLPARFSYPEDAEAHVVKAVKMYKEIFGRAPTGMWPAEGSVAQPVLNIFRRNGILWGASDVKVLDRSEPGKQPNTTAYRFPAGKDTRGNDMSMALVFRDTELSDRIGFTYQNYKGEDAAEDFVRSILSFAPQKNADDVMITVILDGENAWEWYRHDNDGKQFLNAFYRKLSKLYDLGQVITVTTTEYLQGNPARGVAAHPIGKLPAMEWLWPGSWINANYDTWVGENEENRAWEYLLQARRDLEKSGLKRPDPAKPAPKQNSKEWYAWRAWEAMYAAEGSDWFWWFGTDQSAPAGDEPFDEAFRVHLENVYRFANLAGSSIRSPGFAPLLTDETKRAGQGTMARSTVKVLFVCDARQQKVPDGIYIVGNLLQLGEWTPNAIRMYDEGTHGDAVAGDGLWSLLVDVPLGEEVQYKYTNSGIRGQWVQSEEFPQRNRTVTITQTTDVVHTITDIFGQ